MPQHELPRYREWRMWNDDNDGINGKCGMLMTVPN